MKTYLNFSVLLILLSALPLVQCTKEGSLFNSTEEKILGQWRFEKVVFIPNFSLNGDDRTHEYQHKVLDFRKEQQVIKTNTETGDQWNGSWRLSQYVNYEVNAEGATSERLDATLFQNQDNSVYNLTLDHLHVTHKKVRSWEYTDGGRLEIRLGRQ